LDVGLDLLRAEVFENGDNLFHWQSIPPTDVDASEKRNISLHLIAISGVMLRLAPNATLDGTRKE
jgi:hypothetical protein